MLDPAHQPPVGSDELLARYILYSRWFSTSTNAIRQDAFIPPENGELSITRHIEATSEEIWAEGERIAHLRNKTLYGRADVTVSAFLDQGLTVEPDPIPENPNHAIATKWPADKAAKKLLALEIAVRSQFVRR